MTQGTRRGVRAAVYEAWSFLRDGVYAFIDDEALSRGAAIAFYAAAAIGPTLFIVVAIAGVLFGQDAARGAVAEQVHGLIGPQAADLLQIAIHNAAAGESTSLWANALGVAMLVIVASGIFTEMQSALNAIWKVPPRRSWYVSLLLSRLLSLGLVASLGFLLLTSMVITAALSAMGRYVDLHLPIGVELLSIVNFGLSFVLIAVLFAAIYKILPDKNLTWRDVAVGAIGTTVLFQVGQYLLSLYLGSSWIASVYGVAGGLIVLMLWIYYSAEIFLFGAELTKLYAQRYGSHRPAVDPGP
jgi:membrane protein